LNSGGRRTTAVLIAVAWLATACVSFAAEETPYRVINGKVDRQTYNGYRRYNAACNRCHGADGVGSSFGPSLVESSFSYDAFSSVVLYGRANGTSVMRGFVDDPNIAPYMGDLYAYLRARADGAIGRGRPVVDLDLH